MLRLDDRVRREVLEAYRPEVDELDVRRHPLQQDVLGLDVSVDDVRERERPQRAQQLEEELGDRPYRKAMFRFSFVMW